MTPLEQDLYELHDPSVRRAVIRALWRVEDVQGESPGYATAQVLGVYDEPEWLLETEDLERERHEREVATLRAALDHPRALEHWPRLLAEAEGRLRAFEQRVAEAKAQVAPSCAKEPA